MKSGGWGPAVLGLLVMLAAGCVLDAPYSKFAIVYGISDYETINDLQYADDDAIDMAEMLTRQGYDVRWLRTDSAATKTQLLSDIDNVRLAGAKEEDLFLFFFSGHGGQPDTGPEAAAGDSLNECIYLNGPDMAMTDDQLVSTLAAIPCHRKVIIHAIPEASSATRSKPTAPRLLSWRAANP
jgi:hypothetical protein